MSPSLLSLIVWIPFLLIAVGCGIGFALLGFKRGTPRALISVAATLLSAVLAIVIARLVSSLPASFVETTVVNMIGNDYAHLLTGEHMTALIAGVASALSALILFVPIFFLLSLLIKLVSSAVLNNVLPQPEKLGSRLGGMAISIVDAIVLAFLLLLPLYGTIGLADEVLDSVSTVSEELAANETLSAVTDAPLGKIAKFGPFATAYDNLLAFSYEGETVSLSKTVTGVSRLAAGAAAISNLGSGSGEVNVQVIALLDEAEALLTENSFFVGLVTDVASASAPSDDSALATMLTSYEGLSDKETLREDLPALFDVLRSGVETGVIGELLSEEKNLSHADLATFSQTFATSLNSTESLASFKAATVNMLVDTLLEGAITDPAQREELKATLGEVPATPLTGEELKAEGDSITMMLMGIAAMNDTKNNSSEDGSDSITGGISGQAVGNIIEGLARHPSIGVDKTVAIAGTLLGSSGDSAMSEAVTETLRDALNASVSRPVEDATFGAFVDTTINTADVLTQIQNGTVKPETMEQILNAKPEVLTQLKDALTGELLNAFGDLGDDATVMLSLVNSLFTAISENDMTEAERKVEAETLSNTLVLIYQLSNTEGSDPADLIDSYLASEIIGNTVSLMVADGTEDPCEFGLNDESKAAFADVLKEKHEEFKATDPDVIAKLTALATFVGVSVTF